MPYPPPPGPPDVGEFQAIGKLPAPELPDVTGHGGEFLETDGIIPQWQPVSGVLPDPTGHAGEFLTTPDGVTVAWAPGGGTITSLGPVGSAPNANAATITGTVLNLEPANASNPGVASTAAQAFAGEKWFAKGAHDSFYDITQPQYGAVANDPTVDSGDAIRAVFAAWVASGTAYQNSFSGVNATINTLFIPQGVFYVGRPIVFNQQFAEVMGAGKLRSVLRPGPGGVGNVPPFCGPLLYEQGYVDKTNNPGAFPVYASSLLTGAGHSLVVDPHAPIQKNQTVSWYIHDSPVWTGLHGVSALTLECTYDLDADNVGPRPLIGSVGPFAWSARIQNSQFDSALMLQVNKPTPASPLIVQAIITTTDQGGLVINSPTLSPGVHTFEIDFGGGNFDFYVDGVRAGRLTATGTIVRRQWETAGIGGATNDIGGQPWDGAKGKGDGFRLSNVVRHTTNYTPSTSKPTNDSNTVWLCNFDQGDAPDNEPFLLAQSALGWTGPANVTHYCPPWWPPTGVIFTGTPMNYFHDFGLECAGIGSGFIIGLSAFRTVYQRLRFDNATWRAFSVPTQSSFYTKVFDCEVNSVPNGIAFRVCGEMRDCLAFGYGIGWVHMNGMMKDCSGLGGVNGYIDFVVVSLGDAYSYSQLEGCSNDEEGYWPNQRCALLALGGIGSLGFKNCEFSVSAGPNAVAPVLVGGIGNMKFEFCEITANPTVANMLAIDLATDVDPDKKLIWSQSTASMNKPANPNSACGPITDREDLIQFVDNGVYAGLSGLSTTTTNSYNLTGEFYILHGYTVGGPIFFTPEPDGDYIPVIEYAGYSGSSPPAAGSTTGWELTSTAATGFTITLPVDPGGDCQLKFLYHLIRTSSPKLAVYLPSLPASQANPYSGKLPHIFAVGVSLDPVGGNFMTNWSSTAFETIAQSGAGTGTGEWQLMYNVGGAQLSLLVGGVGIFPFDAWLSDELKTPRIPQSLLNPGPHTIWLTYDNRRVSFYIDGRQTQFAIGGIVQMTAQAATIYLGQDNVGGSLMATATIRNFRVADQLKDAAVIEPDVGPLGKPLYAFFGDELTVGQGGTTASFASQIAIARIASKYYYMCCKVGGRYNSWGGYTTGILDYWWKQWGSLAGLGAICLQSGFWDLVAAPNLATDIFGDIASIVEGGPASGTFHPNSENAQAWGHIYPPNAGAGLTGQITLAGVVFNMTCTGSTIPDTLTDCNALIAAIQANGTTNAAVTCNLIFDNAQPNGGRWLVNVTAIPIGSLGNAITLTTPYVNGDPLGHGVLLWSGPTTTGLTLGGGVDATVTITISGTDYTVVSNFDTDADTTINNIIALFNAIGAVTAAVTLSLDSVNHVMKVVTNAPGIAGNSIGTTRLPVLTQIWDNQTLVGGYDGASQIGVNPIVLCTVPPFGTNGLWTAPIETQRAALNTLIKNYCAAHPAYMQLADLDLALQDGGTPINLNPTYDAGNGKDLNDAGQTVVYGIINPLLP